MWIIDRVIRTIDTVSRSLAVFLGTLDALLARAGAGSRAGRYIGAHRGWCGSGVRAVIRAVVLVIVVVLTLSWSVRVFSGTGGSEVGDALIVLMAWLISAAERLSTSWSVRRPQWGR